MEFDRKTHPVKLRMEIVASPGVWQLDMKECHTGDLSTFSAVVSTDDGMYAATSEINMFEALYDVATKLQEVIDAQ